VIDVLNPAAGDRRRDPVYRFADCRLDGRSLELTVNGELARLEPKPMELLLFLLRHPGEVVTRDELQDGVWPGRILSDSVLTKTVARLRLALADEAQAIIRTVHGYGYRLIAPVSLDWERGAMPAAPQLDLKPGSVPPLRPHWRLETLLGRGGLGEVWLGRHAGTGERRVFKFALDAAGLTALKREITLHRLLRNTYGERPDFIPLLDWNVDEPPCFIEAEYAEGGSLVDWLASRGGVAQLPLEERLELVAQAADALAAAHAAGVLHKDLKPSNLLVRFVDGDPARPQLALGDLGSGRLMDLARLDALEITRLGYTRVATAGDAAGVTDTGDGSGTPFYFAPELLAGQQPTVQTDLYALGVILYQMVVGDLKRPLSADWVRDIDDPLLRDDISVAAAGRPAERLGDAAELARRLRQLPARHAALAEQQRQAAEAEQLREALSRTRTRRRLQGAVAASLALGLVAALWQYRSAEQARERAEAAALEAEAVAGFVTDDLLQMADPMLSQNPRLTVRDLLVDAAGRLDRRTTLSTAARARILAALGRAHVGLGDWATARSVLERALAEAEAAAGPQAESTLRVAAALAYAQVLVGDYEAAEARYRQIIAAGERYGAASELMLDAREGISFLDNERGHFIDAIAGQEAMRRDLARLGKLDRLTETAWNLAETYLELGRTDEAESVIHDGIATAERQFGPDHPRVHALRLTLGDVLMQRRDWDGADALYRASLDALRESLGAEHPNALHALHYHGHLLLKRGDAAAALPVLKAAWDGRRRAHGDDHPYPRFSAHRYAQALTALGRTDESLPLLRETLAAAERQHGARHPNALDIRCSLAEALHAAGRSDEARALVVAARPWVADPQLEGSERRRRVEQLAARLAPS